MNIIQNWIRRSFSNPQVVVLALVLAFCIGVFVFIGDTLVPAFASLVVAFLLEGLIKPLEKRRVPRLLAVCLVFTAFLCFLLFLIIGLLPLLSNQITQFIQEIPGWLMQGQAALMRLPEYYPQFFTQAQISEVIGTVKNQITAYGQYILSFSLSSMRSLLSMAIYTVLMPIMVFFFLKDKDKIMHWIRGFLPEDHSLTSAVWFEVKTQTGNYVRGKIWEIFIIWFVSYIVFLILGLHYALLLSFLVGLSVIIPYVGATLVTIPVLCMAYFQWGLTPDFAKLAVAYGIIQVLDGNLLVPILLSGVVDIHPLGIILSILVFGGLWGVWGVFFAIPLTTLIQAVINAWPRFEQEQNKE